MKLTNFLYCLNAERKQNSQGAGESINAIGVLAVMTPEFVPGAFSFSIIFSILGVDINSNNQVKIVFKDNTERELVNTGNIQLPSIPIVDGLQLPSEYIGYNLSMDFRNVVFENIGEHTTDVYFNDVLLGSNSIYVKGKR